MSSPRTTIAVSGISITTSIGDTETGICKNLNSKTHGLKSKHRFTSAIDAVLGETETKDQTDKLTETVSSLIRELDRSTSLFARYSPEDIGFFFGTTTAGYNDTRSQMFSCIDEKKPLTRKYLTAKMQQGSLLETVRDSFPISGLSLGFSTACSSGALAIAEACDALRCGVVKACIAGGVDILNETTIRGFDSLKVLDHKPSRPFTPERQGMNLAEGGCFLLLEAEPSGEVVGYVCGSGISSDSYHPTHPEPDGLGMQASMSSAIENARISPNEVGFVNAHGTGTLPNDKAEAAAINRVFGNQTGFASTKKFHGHTLGAAGAIEAAVTLYGLNQKLSPEVLALHGGSVKNYNHALSNSFGFGGNNVSLVLSGRGAKS